MLIMIQFLYPMCWFSKCVPGAAAASGNSSDLQFLGVPYMYASGGPSGASTTQGIFIYNAFNTDLNYGRGSAASVVLLVVIAVLTMVQMHFENVEQG